MFGLFKKVPKKDVKEIDSISNKHRIIDIRTKKELTQYGKVKGIRHIPMDELLANPEKYLMKDENHEYYIMCQTGNRSKKTVKALNEQGFNTVNLRGGYFYYSRF